MKAPSRAGDAGKVNQELAKKLVEATARIDALARDRDMAIKQRDETRRQLDAILEELKRHTDTVKESLASGNALHGENEAIQARLEAMSREKGNSPRGKPSRRIRFHDER